MVHVATSRLILRVTEVAAAAAPKSFLWLVSGKRIAETHRHLIERRVGLIGEAACQLQLITARPVAGFLAETQVML